ncbi:hypothetical protein ACIGEZ_09020 [Streptomyces sp. NPDC085481]|uniref:hypothetical protein n=1 Tax=Streptomyces sp. NPDC085481 TaxID=3365727 RepID=UPI0037CE9992
MTTLYTTPSGYGRHRQSEPRFEESLQREVPAPPPHPSDPPIYRAVLTLWASHGKTLPGHRDQEWSRLAAGPVWADRTVRVSGTLVRQGDGR